VNIRRFQTALSTATKPYRPLNLLAVVGAETGCYSRGLRHKVLVVDDEADILELLSYNRQPGGDEIFCAGNGMEALNQARKHLPDLSCPT